MNRISPKNSIMIHAAKARLRLSDDSYHDMLGSYGVKSSKDLDNIQAAEFLQALNTMVFSQSVNGRQSQARQPATKKYDHLGDREGFATPKQLRYIEVLWSTVSKQETPAARADALRVLQKKIVGFEEITWLEPMHVRKMVNAIKTMKKQAETKEKIDAGKSGAGSGCNPPAHSQGASRPVQRLSLPARRVGKSVALLAEQTAGAEHPAATAVA